jgi:single-stranded-DNA-specific exonuclease
LAPVEDARAAARRLKHADGTVRIAAHADADSVLAAALLAATLRRQSRAFHVRFTQERQEAVDADDDPREARILLGLEPPAQSALAGLAILVDARPGPARQDTEHVLTLNPIASGAPDGTASVATTGLALALALDSSNWDLAPWALAGALSSTSTGPAPTGWNLHVLDEAKRLGHLRDETGLLLPDEPLIDLLARPPPVLRGLLPGGRPSAQELLTRHGLPPEATVHELDARGRQALASLLMLTHLRSGRPAADAARLFGPRPVAPALGALPLLRLASWADAAARQGEAGLMIALALGDNAARRDLEAVELTHRRRLRQLVEAIAPAAGGQHLVRVAVDAPAYTTALARLAVQRLLDDRAVMVHAPLAGNRVRVSVQVPIAWAERGLDLASAVHTAAEAVGGRSTGRVDEADAWLPQGGLDGFIAALDHGLAPMERAAQ